MLQKKSWSEICFLNNKEMTFCETVEYVSLPSQLPRGSYIIPLPKQILERKAIHLVKNHDH